MASFLFGKTLSSGGKEKLASDYNMFVVIQLDNNGLPIPNRYVNSYHIAALAISIRTISGDLGWEVAEWNELHENKTIKPANRQEFMELLNELDNLNEK